MYPWQCPWQTKHPLSAKNQIPQGWYATHKCPKADGTTPATFELEGAITESLIPLAHLCKSTSSQWWIAAPYVYDCADIYVYGWPHTTCPPYFQYILWFDLTPKQHSTHQPVQISLLPNGSSYQVCQLLELRHSCSFVLMLLHFTGVGGGWLANIAEPHQALLYSVV